MGNRPWWGGVIGVMGKCEVCSLPPSKFSQGQDRDRSPFSILQGIDKVIRHFRKLPAVGKGGYLDPDGVRRLLGWASRLCCLK